MTGLKRLAPLCATLGLLVAACQTVPLPDERVVQPQAPVVATDASGALQAFRLSCAKGLPARPSAWQGAWPDAARWRAACDAGVSAGDAGMFFSEWFMEKPLGQGLLTGYYAPELELASARSVVHSAPVYGLPSDYVQGRPYRRRAEIEASPPPAPVLGWADAVDLFFLQVQGSGFARLTDGGAAQLRFAGHNGQAYTAIGKLLLERGELPPGGVSKQSIEAWLRANPAEAPLLMRENDRYVFFELADAQAVRGAANLALTPGHSIAADAAHMPFGLPLLIESGDAQVGRRIVVVQDRGGAITGATRADLYTGRGQAAEALAGRLQAQTRFTALLPR